MAVVKLLNFRRGRLGDIGFRQQFVKDGKGSYSRQTVAFQIPESVTNPNTPGQVRQRTRFRLIQSLATALTSVGVLRNFYASPSGLSGYNAFIRDNIQGAIAESGGLPFVDFRKLQVTFGDFYKKVVPYKAESAPVDDCHCQVKLAWNYDWTEDPQGKYALICIGIKVDQEGAVDGIELVQPRTPMSACTAEIDLPTCDCCKTYWYAFFVDPVTGYYATSSYIGTCDCELPEFTDTCITCNLQPGAIEIAIPPEECPVHCGDVEVDKSAIVFQGQSRVSGSGGPSGGVLFTACPVYAAGVEVIENTDGTYDLQLILSGNEMQTYEVLDEDGATLGTFTEPLAQISGLASLPTTLEIQVGSTDTRCDVTLVLEAGSDYTIPDASGDSSTGEGEGTGTGEPMASVMPIDTGTAEMGTPIAVDLKTGVDGCAGVTTYGAVSNLVNITEAEITGTAPALTVTIDPAIWTEDMAWGFDVEAFCDGTSIGLIKVSGRAMIQA